MNIKTLSDAANIIDYLREKRNLSLEQAIEDAGVPIHLLEQVRKYYSPPLEIVSPDIVADNSVKIRLCDVDERVSEYYFGAYSRFLIDGGKRSKSIVDTLSATSLDLIRRLPKPDSAPSFRTRGLVVGYIQSGKTANMAALIARAADQGYKLFIVLGGLWKDLRKQTQDRLDREIAGASDDQDIGSCVEYDLGVPRWVRLTRSGLNGDFSPGSFVDLNPNTPKLAVIKKNKKIEDLAYWLKQSPVPLDQLPAIIIDDEADQASINTNYGKKDEDGEDIDPAATNRRIRELLALLPKSVYIGFTATPFANVLIDATVDEDLYPKDFIATLPEPPGYFGPKRLFGLGLQPSDLSPGPSERPSLDIIRHIDDSDLEALDGVVESGGDCPKILQEAMMSFVLGCCGRLARGQEREHFSMLVHPSQKTDTHEAFAKTIRDEVKLIRGIAARPSIFPDFMSRARDMWEGDFRRVTQEQDDASLKDFDFDTIWKFARGVVESIEVKVLNFQSTDELQYKEPFKRYIVVGGNRLSRGLTLEGLSVSVFTRNANQYDTLLQMGRWFGYRPGYHDLTRIYIDRALADRFAELARVEDELRTDMQKYSRQPDPLTPMELKPIIRRHPTMAVTSKFKMGAGCPKAIAFEDTKSETVTFPVKNKALLRKNVEAVRGLLSGLKASAEPTVSDGTFTWTDVPSKGITSFLDDFEFSREANYVNRHNLVGYISRQNSRGELVLWDVVLPQGNRTREPFTWTDDVITHKILRSPLTSQSIKVLSDPRDIERWRSRLGRDQHDPTRGCLMVYMIDRKSDEDTDVKFFTSPAEVEDIVGLVLIFPDSKSHETVEYISQ